MEHLFVVLALDLMLVMLLIACGSKRTLTPVPTPGFPHIEDLQAALLTTSDLPAGWTAQPVRSSNELSTLPCGAPLPDVRVGDFILQVGETMAGGVGSDLTTTVVQKAILDFQAARLTP
ncbi:MAG TPA: hypothetical protein VF201_09545 [Nitrolancea sp.]